MSKYNSDTSSAEWDFAVDDLSLRSRSPRPAAFTLPRSAKRPAANGNTSPSKKPKLNITRMRALPKRRTAYDDPEKILGNPKSAIYKQDVDVAAILQHPQAQGILASLPNGYQFEDTSYNDLARACVEFKNEGQEGRYEYEWLEQSCEAKGRRENGDFDEMFEEKFRNDWVVDSGEELSDSDEEELPENGAELVSVQSVQNSSRGPNGQTQHEPRPANLDNWEMQKPASQSGYSNDQSQLESNGSRKNLDGGENSSGSNGKQEQALPNGTKFTNGQPQLESNGAGANLIREEMSSSSDGDQEQVSQYGSATFNSLTESEYNEEMKYYQ